MKTNPGTIDLSSRLALRPKEAAAALGVSDRTLRDWMRNEELPYVQIGRGILIPTSELEGWMRQRLARQAATDDLTVEILEGLAQGERVLLYDPRVVGIGSEPAGTRSTPEADEGASVGLTPAAASGAID